MKTFLVILCFCFFCSGDDPPKSKRKVDTVQVQRSLNLEELRSLKKSYDTLVLKQDTLIKKK